MLNRLIDIAIKNRVLVALVLLAILLATWFTLPSLNLDAFPDVTNVQVQVNTEAPGLASKEKLSGSGLFYIGGNPQRKK